MISLPLDPEKVRNGVEAIIVLPYVISRTDLANCLNWHDENDASMIGCGSVRILDVSYMHKGHVFNRYSHACFGRGMEQQLEENIVTVVRYVAWVQTPAGSQQPKPETSTAPTAIYIANAHAELIRSRLDLLRIQSDHRDMKTSTLDDRIADAATHFKKVSGQEPKILLVNAHTFFLLENEKISLSRTNDNDPYLRFTPVYRGLSVVVRDDVKGFEVR